MLRYISAVCALVLIVSLVNAQDDDDSTYMAPYSKPDSDAVIENDYIVMFHCGYNISEHSDYLGFDMSMEDKFLDMSFLPGYRAVFDNDTLTDVRSDPGVKSVEHNLIVSLVRDVIEEFEESDEDRNLDNGEGVDEDEQSSGGVSRLARRLVRTVSGLTSYGQRMIWSESTMKTPVNKGFRTMPAEAGKGVSIYIVDDGMDIDHPALGGRASQFRGLTKSPWLDGNEGMGETPSDRGFGHGTAMASILLPIACHRYSADTQFAGVAAGVPYGTAPYANIINAKVLDSLDGPEEQIFYHILLTAIHDITEEHKAQVGKAGYRGGIISLSLGIPDIPEPEEREDSYHVLAAAVESGMLLVAAAGNEGVDARNSWPCNSRLTVCVGATDNSYAPWSESNYGSAVDIWAPGDFLPVLPGKGIFALAKRASGTSAPTAAVAGLAAYFMSHEALTSAAVEGNLALTVQARLAFNALIGVLSDLRPDDNNVFANAGMGRGRPGTDEPYHMGNQYNYGPGVIRA